MTSSGIYYDTLQTTSGCDSVVTLNLTIHSSPILDLGDDTTICHNTSVNLDAGTGYTYAWNDGSANQTLTVNNSGEYTVVITDGNGCTTRDSINVNVLSPITANYTLQDVSCNGLSDGLAIATVTGGLQPYSYLWYNDGQTYSNSVASNLPAGTYSFMITDSIGCSLTDSVVINEPLPLTISVSHPDSIADFIYVGEHNNQYIYFHPNTLSWTNSRQKAQANGGDLLVLKDSITILQFTT